MIISFDGVKDKIIHIVCFDVPFPADYGGVIDIFTRAKSLSDSGWKVHLHCFKYLRDADEKLNSWAETVHYYHRPRAWYYLFSKTPFIVKTRHNKLLAERLREAEGVVLLEGLHCSSYLKDNPGKYWVRTHNIEHDYYQALSEKTDIKRWFYFKLEARKLKRFEPVLKLAKGLLTISNKDQQYFQALHPNCHLIPSIFIPRNYAGKTDDFILFHGNLSVKENQNAVKWLMSKVYTETNVFKWIIAGKNPPKKLSQMVEKLGAICMANPSEEQLHELVDKAKVHVLYSDQETGFKLKFLEACRSNGFVLCNDKFLTINGLDKHVYVANTPQEYISKLLDIYYNDVNTDSFSERHVIIDKFFGKDAVVDKLEGLLLD